nr:hypothetical protein [Solemoviridae sp.]
MYSYKFDADVSATGLVALVHRLLLNLTVMTLEFEERDREPLTWWEWILTWFGYRCYDVIPVYTLDYFRCAAVVLGISIALVIATNLLLALMWFIMVGIGRLAKAFRQAMVSYVSLFSCVFRWLASPKDPGRTVQAVVASVSPLHGMAPESLVPGSTFSHSTFPRCQGMVGKVYDGVFRADGCFIRVQTPTGRNFIFLPQHVLAHLYQHGTLSNGVVHITIDPKLLPEGRDRLCCTLATDYSALEVVDSEMSKLGLKVAKIYNLIPSSGTLAKIVGPGCQSSVAVLHANGTSFGLVQYEGSTLPGFSGAAYLVNDAVAGVHSWGGRANMGYSMRLLYVTLLHAIGSRPESSENFLEENIRSRKRAVWIDESWQDEDYVRIQLKGEYHIVSREALRGVLGAEKDLAGWVTYESASPAPGYPSGFNLAENYNPVVIPGASRQLTESPQEQIQKLQDTINGLKSNLKGLQRQMNSAGRPRPSVSRIRSDTTQPPSPPNQPSLPVPESSSMRSQ